MPKIRRRNLPPALLQHLLDRIQSREISPEQLGEFARWLDTEPEVPAARWFKRFSAMTVCGEDDFAHRASRIRGRSALTFALNPQLSTLNLCVLAVPSGAAAKTRLKDFIRRSFLACNKD